MNEDTNTNVDQKELPTIRQSKLPTIPQLVVALGILALVFGSSYIPQPSPQESPKTATEVPPSEVQQTAVSPFAGITIGGGAAFVWDVRQQRALYTKNADAQLPLASLTKLMTALVTHETLHTNQIVRIPLDAIQQEGESGFLDGETWATDELLNYTLLTSSNDGAYALAAAAGAALERSGDNTQTFINTMNLRAEELGLAQTYFVNPTGLDTSEAQSGGYGSARDMAFLMEYIITQQPEILEGTTVAKTILHNQIGAAYTATNTNEIVDRIPGILGSKTGYTVLAGGNLVVAFDAGLNHPVIIAVLGSSIDGRFDDVSLLAKKVQEEFLRNQ